MRISVSVVEVSQVKASCCHSRCQGCTRGYCRSQEQENSSFNKNISNQKNCFQDWDLVISRELPRILFSVDLIFLIRVSPSDKISRKHFNASLIMVFTGKGRTYPGCRVLFSCYSLISPGHRCALTGQMSRGGRCWAPDKGTDVLEWRLRVRVTRLGGKEEGSKGWLLDTLTQSPVPRIFEQTFK